jgi:hypothetical protein
MPTDSLILNALRIFSIQIHREMQSRTTIDRPVMATENTNDAGNR